MKSKAVSALAGSAVLLILAFLLRFLSQSSPVLLALSMAAGVSGVTVLVCFVLGLIHPKSHRARTILTLLNSLLRYAAALVILCWGLSILGVDVSVIVASVGVVALVVGFGVESLIADVVTGTFILFENQYNVGDIVEVGGFRGTVKDIGIRTTAIEDAGGNVKIINNSEMKNILNRSDHASRAVCDIDIPYETDLEALEERIPALLEEIYRQNAGILKSVPAYLGVEKLGASSVVLRFVAEVAEKDLFTAGRVLNRSLWLGLRRLGVECPFQQLDVHTK